MGVSIFVDCQSAILAVKSNFITSALVKETIDLLNQAASTVSNITIHWVKGHAQHLGNEMADELAKKGAHDIQRRVNDPPMVPKATVKAEVSKLTAQMWRNLWLNLEHAPVGYRCNQSKLWFPEGPRLGLTYTLLSMPRASLSHMIGFITGHNFLKRHEDLIAAKRAEKDGEDHVPDKWCDFCGGGEQTSRHILSDCDALAALRQMCL